MARKLFGTDGVRGVAGQQLTAELALRLGTAAVHQLGVERPRVLVIRDTRESGAMLEAAVTAGLTVAGADALIGGVLPTPAAPLLLARHGLDMAVVISASHNPYADNGIKFFGHDGYKLSDAAEAAIEAELDRERSTGEPGRERAIGGVHVLPDTVDDYLHVLEERFRDRVQLSGLDVVLDCANGATFRVAPEIFRRLGATVTALAVDPDGRNINAGSGSTHLEQLRERVVSGGHDVGFAFDGDGDRVLAVDREGEVVDGDELLALAALHLREQGRLTGNGVVVTVMTNFGFHVAMEGAGIEVASTQVGDRYVLEELLARGWTLGGEQSGHIIERGFVSTGDGIASALLTLEALGPRNLAERAAMRKLPQRLVNVRVRDRRALDGARALWEAVEHEQEGLNGRGRVLVRASGTEPLVRVMVEAPSESETEAVCQRLVALVQDQLG